MNTKNNQRFQDTEKRIQDTLLELARTTNVRQVTVRAICEKAEINRSTFYAHYVDIHDLVDKMGIQMIKDIARMFEESGDVQIFFLSQPGLTQMITYVKEHQDFFDIYLNHYRNNADQMFSLLWDDFGKPYLESLGLRDESKMWYHFLFFKAGFLAVLGQWVQKDCPESPEALARIILQSLPLNHTNSRR